MLQWLDDQASEDIVTTVITAAELRAGIAVMSEGRRRDAIGSGIEHLLVHTFARLILPFSVDCTAAYALVMSGRKDAGRPINTADAYIAAICITVSAVLATRNTKDFAGVGLDLINPW